jgi:hypothetical protein
VAKVINFPESEPFYDFDSDCLIFGAIVDGKSVECVLTAGLLVANFGASDIDKESLLKAYQVRKEEIHTLARKHIEHGWIDEESRVFLTKRFTRLNVTFGGLYNESSIVRSLVDSAHRNLLDIIGPNAEEVNVKWNGDDVPPRISLQITDPETSHTVKSIFSPKDSADTGRLGISLGLLWSKVLRERSLKHGLKMS